MFGVMMFTSKLLMEGLPNIHLIGMFTVLLTVVYRKRALYPIYIFVFLTGAYNGFLSWWIPYLYIWTVLWGVVMLLPRDLPDRWAAVIYPVVCALHGLAFGTLYAPLQALMYGLGWQGMLAWIAAGFPFDLIQAGELKKASEIVIKATPVLRLIFAESNPGPLKEAMKMIGIDCGDPLLPLEKPGKHIVDALEVELKKLLDWYK